MLTLCVYTHSFSITIHILPTLEIWPGIYAFSVVSGILCNTGHAGSTAPSHMDAFRLILHMPFTFFTDKLILNG